MIKGHTKIELKDEVTGEVKTVEQDNMLTNALAELAKPIGGANGLYSHLCISSPYSVVESLFGGVMLFEEPLSSDPDDYIWPFANPCTGFASNFAYSGVNTKLGGYNSAESGLQEDGSYKHVWDFATDSGNGTISSLGLTSVHSACIGLGSMMYDFGVTAQKYIFFSEDRVFVFGERYYKPLFIKNGYLYWVPLSTFTGTNNVYNNGGIFTIKKTRILAGFVSLTTAYNRLISENIEIQLPSDFINQYSISSSEYAMAVEYKDDVISLACTQNGISAGETRIFCHINCNDNFSTTTTTFTNTTDERIDSGSYGYRGNIKPMHDYCIMQGASSKNVYIVKTQDCTDVKRVQLSNGEIFISAGYMMGTIYTDATNAVIMFGPSSSSNYTYYCLFINLKSGKASYGNTKEAVSYASGTVAMTDGGLLGIAMNTSYTLSFISRFINPFFLTTKNNLSEPVTKTATQSMKITYTLREE